MTTHEAKMSEYPLSMVKISPSHPLLLHLTVHGTKLCRTTTAALFHRAHLGGEGPCPLMVGQATEAIKDLLHVLQVDLLGLCEIPTYN